MSKIRSGPKALWKSAAAGAVGGFVASFAMNQFQALLSAASEARSKQQHEQQPSRQGDDATVRTAAAISRNLLHHELTQDEKKWAGPAVHYTFGTVLGACYGVLAETVPLAHIGAGTAFGAAVWLTADEIAVPAFGLSQSAANAPWSSHASALAAHLVFGVTTSVTRELILQIS